MPIVIVICGLDGNQTEIRGTERTIRSSCETLEHINTTLELAAFTSFSFHRVGCSLEDCASPLDRAAEIAKTPFQMSLLMDSDSPILSSRPQPGIDGDALRRDPFDDGGAGAFLQDGGWNCAEESGEGRDDADDVPSETPRGHSTHFPSGSRLIRY